MKSYKTDIDKNKKSKRVKINSAIKQTEINCKVVLLVNDQLIFHN